MAPKKLVVEIPADVTELTLLFGRASLENAPPTRVRRCRALKRSGGRCQHTTDSARINEAGFCTCSHRDWLQRRGKAVPEAELWVDRA